MGWQKAVGYGRRSHAETAMFRFKAIMAAAVTPGSCLPGRPKKATCSVLNRMPRLGMSMSQRIAWNGAQLPPHFHNLICTPKPCLPA